MKNRSNIVTIRLSDDEYTYLGAQASSHNMTSSQYIRMLIAGEKPANNVMQSEAACVLCRVYALLQKYGLETEEISKEVHKLCRM